MLLFILLHNYWNILYISIHSVLSLIFLAMFGSTMMVVLYLLLLFYPPTPATPNMSYGQDLSHAHTQLEISLTLLNLICTMFLLILDYLMIICTSHLLIWLNIFSLSSHWWPPNILPSHSTIAIFTVVLLFFTFFFFILILLMLFYVLHFSFYSQDIFSLSPHTLLN